MPSRWGIFHSIQGQKPKARSTEEAADFILFVLDPEAVSITSETASKACLRPSPWQPDPGWSRMERRGWCCSLVCPERCFEHVGIDGTPLSLPAPRGSCFLLIMITSLQTPFHRHSAAHTHTIAWFLFLREKILFCVWPSKWSGISWLSLPSAGTMAINPHYWFQWPKSS